MNSVQIVLLTFPFITSLFFALVMRKAGFGWWGMALGFLPLLGAALPMIFVGLFRFGLFKPGLGVFAFVPVAGQVLTLVPLGFLLAAKWPQRPGVT